MQTEYLQKIQNLVAQSAVLAASEKSEWMELMDMMTDKQLLELERILIAVQNIPAAPKILPKPEIKPVVVPPPVKVVSPPVAPAPPPVLPKNLPIAREPGPASFKHILNFPQSSGAATAPRVPAPVHLVSKTIEQKKESPFLSKLKAIFSEKELPSGQLDELPAPESVQKPAVIKSEVKTTPIKPVPKPVEIAEKEAPKPPPAKPKAKEPAGTTINIFLNKQEQDRPEDLQKIISAARQAAGTPAGAAAPEALAPLAAQEPPKPKLDFSPKPESLSDKVSAAMAAARQAAAKPAPLPPEPEAEPAENPLKPWNQEESGLLDASKKAASTSTAAAKTPSHAGPAPGLNFSEGPTAADLRSRLAGDSAKQVVAVSIPGRIILEQKTGDDMKLETLEDISALKADVLQLHATGTLFQKFQKLIRQFGPHEVIFRLEQSPLYKAYIQTGVVWLKAGARKSSADDLQMPGQDFERFADFLIMLRSRA